MQPRNPITQTVLTALVPLYLVYWLYVVSQDIRRRGVAAPSLWLLLSPYLGFTAAILLLLIASALSANQTTEVLRVVSVTAGLVGLVSVIALIVCSLWYFIRFGQAAAQLTKNEVPTWLSVLLFLLLPPVLVYILEEQLAKTGQVAAPD